jgi:protocatechuate 3,4-dioxygenase beta subunit
MMFVIRRLFLVSLLAGAVLAAGAEQPAPATGVVAGTVTFGDTQRPARFASVTLTPVKSDESATEKALVQAGKDKNPMSALGALFGGMTMLSGQTDLAGRYEIEGVAPGEYFVLVNVPGYVSAGAVSMATGQSDLAGAPRVHVDGVRPAHEDVSLTRGAAISGRVTFEDGSPLTAGVVSVNATAKPQKQAKDEVDIGRSMAVMMSGGLKIAQTDDRGTYRIAGLAPGEYTVAVKLVPKQSVHMNKGVIGTRGMTTSTIEIYAPATEHLKDAAKFTVKSGDDLTDENITVDLSAMHSVSGTVASSADHHLLNSGTITLTDVADKTVKREAAVTSDGSFELIYVPAGSYTLTTSALADTAANPKAESLGPFSMAVPKTLQGYADVTQPVIVGQSDVTGVHLEAAPKDKAAKADGDDD